MTFENKSLVFAAILVILASLIYRLFDMSQIINNFSFDFVNDMSSYMAQLFFLDACGFHNFCPYWYNGFISFLQSPPGWYFFTYPIYLLVEKNVTLAFYISMILLYILAFVAVYFLSNLFKWNLLEKILFFTLFFANPVAIGDFVRLGRLHELLGWICFSIIAFCFLYCKDKKINWKIILLSPIYAYMILSNFVVAILGSIFILGMFIIKRGKEFWLVVITILSGALMSAFWWVPFILNVKNTDVLISGFSDDLFLGGFFSLVFLTIFFTLITFIILYVISLRTRNDKLFFVPVIILLLFYVTNLSKYVFFLTGINYGSYVLLLLFFIIFFVIELRLIEKSKFLVFVLLIFSLVSFFYTISIMVDFTSYKDNYVKIELDELATNMAPGEMIIIYFGESFGNFSTKAFYSYAPIYYGLYAAYGWYPHLTTPLYIKDFKKIFKYESCEENIDSLMTYNITSIIASKKTCESLSNECGFVVKNSTKNFCVLNLPTNVS